MGTAASKHALYGSPGSSLAPQGALFRPISSPATLLGTITGPLLWSRNFLGILCINSFDFQTNSVWFSFSLLLFLLWFVHASNGGPMSPSLFHELHLLKDL